LESVRRVVDKSFSFAGLNRDGKGGTGLVEGPEELAEAFKEVNMPVMVKKRKGRKEKFFFCWFKRKYRKADH
jgi:hypothetical protein